MGAAPIARGVAAKHDLDLHHPAQQIMHSRVVSRRQAGSVDERRPSPSGPPTDGFSYIDDTCRKP